MYLVTCMLSTLIHPSCKKYCFFCFVFLSKFPSKKGKKLFASYFFLFQANERVTKLVQFRALILLSPVFDYSLLEPTDCSSFFSCLFKPYRYPPSSRACTKRNLHIFPGHLKTLIHTLKLRIGRIHVLTMKRIPNLFLKWKQII